MIADKFKNRYYINGVNIFDAYGVVIETGGYAELLKEPTRKEGYAFVWKDQNGTERDISAYFETRTINLTCTFVCETLADYLQKSKAFFNLLKSKDAEEDETGYITLSSTTLGMEWELFYTNTTSVEELTPMYTGGEVVVKHYITLLDDNVSGGVFKPMIFLTDEQGNYLTDENGNYLTEQPI